MLKVGPTSVKIKQNIKGEGFFSTTKNIISKIPILLIKKLRNYKLIFILLKKIKNFNIKL